MPAFRNASRSWSATVLASELKALLPLENLDLNLDVAAVAQFLALGYIPAPRTHLKGISKLRAGEAIVFGPESEKRIFRYWKPEFLKSNGHALFTQEEAIQAVRDRFREAVRIRLRSDVPVGSYVSGGIDSSIVASLAAERHPTGFAGFTGRFGTDTAYAEGRYARDVAAQGGFPLHELDISAQVFVDHIGRVIYHLDFPVAGPGPFPQYVVPALARRHRKVLLGGQRGHAAPYFLEQGGDRRRRGTGGRGRPEAVQPSQ